MGVKPTGYALVAVGALLALIVFYYALTLSLSYEAPPIPAESTTTALAAASSALIEALVRLAFLGLGLAASATLLGNGVRLLRGDRGEGRGEQ